jgi:hypothetical protein
MRDRMQWVEVRCDDVCWSMERVLSERTDFSLNTVFGDILPVLTTRLVERSLAIEILFSRAITKRWKSHPCSLHRPEKMFKPQRDLRVVLLFCSDPVSPSGFLTRSSKASLSLIVKGSVPSISTSGYSVSNHNVTSFAIRSDRPTKTNVLNAIYGLTNIMPDSTTVSYP